MKLQIAAACAALSLGLASVARADTISATLERPVASHAQFLLAHADWNCDGATCVGARVPAEAGALFGCRALVKKVGPVTAYSEFKPTDDASLAKCNTAAAGPAPIGTASR
ncbi:MAG: hypothetical protein H0X27_05190 [Caulobacteraceae bacterium]|nr:hypothetical protein [Caulobacteraceae bacterium]